MDWSPQKVDFFFRDQYGPLYCQVTCSKEKTHDNIVKIVKLQWNAPKSGEYIPTDIGMAAAIPAGYPTDYVVKLYYPFYIHTYLLCGRSR